MGELWMPGGLQVRVLVDGEATGGAFCLIEDEPPAGWSLPPHSHVRESETIYVVDGQFSVEVGTEEILSGPGDVIHIPAGVTHSARTLGDEPGRRLITFAPAGIEAFFREVGEREPATEHDLVAVAASAARHGWQF
ncbi:MAG: cupin domain-containing protein [Solirubrobacteraceae bacterium]|nr:cupin domain-containing protein [Solirubrobacteraceae bacterium]